MIRAWKLICSSVPGFVSLTHRDLYEINESIQYRLVYLADQSRCDSVTVMNVRMILPMIQNGCSAEHQ